MPQAQIRSWGPEDISKVLWGRHRLDADIRTMDAGPVSAEFAEDARGLSQRWGVAIPLGVGAVEASIEALFADGNYEVWSRPDRKARTLSVIMKAADEDVVSYPRVYRPPSTVKFGRDGLVMASAAFVGGGEGEIVGRLIVEGDVTATGWGSGTPLRQDNNKFQSAMVATGYVAGRELTYSASVGALVLAPHIRNLDIAIQGGATAGANPAERERLVWTAHGEDYDDLGTAVDPFMCVEVVWDGDSWTTAGNALANSDSLTVLDGGTDNEQDADLVLKVDEYIRIGSQIGDRHRVTAVARQGDRQVLTLDPVLGSNVNDASIVVADPTGSKADEVNVIVHRERSE